MKIDKDILEKVQKEDSSSMNAFSQKPAGGQLLQEMFSPGNPGVNFARGFVQAGTDTLAAIPNLFKMGYKNLRKEKFTPWRLNISQPGSPASTLGELAGTAMPTGIGMLGKLFGASKINPNYLRDIAGSAIGGGAMAAGYDATLNPEESLSPRNIALGTILGGAGRGISGAPAASARTHVNILKRRQKESPSQMRSPEEAEKLAALFPNQKVDIGALTGHQPSESLYSDILGRMPFTGVRKQERGMISAADKEASKYAKELEGIARPENFTETIERGTRKAYNPRKEKADIMYKNLREKAEGIKEAKGEPKELMEYLHKELGAWTPKEKAGKTPSKRAIRLSDISEKMQKSSDIKSFMSKKDQETLLKHPEYTAALKGIDPKSMHVSDLMETYQNINKLLRKTSDRTKKRTLRGMNQSIEKSIERILEEKKQPKLLDAWKETRKHYREEVVPYKGDIEKVRYGALEEKNVPEILSQRKNKKVFSDLGEAPKGLVKRKLFGKNATAEEIAKKYESMSAEELNRLFTKAELKKMKEIEQMNLLTSAGRKRQGESWEKNLIKKTLGTAAGAAGLLLSPITARPLAKMLRSESVRNAYTKGKHITEKGLNKEIIHPFLRQLKRTKNIPNYLLAKNREESE